MYCDLRLKQTWINASQTLKRETHSRPASFELEGYFTYCTLLLTEHPIPEYAQTIENNLECTHSNAQHPFLGPIFVPGWLDLSPGLLTQGISGLLSWNWFNIAQPPVQFMPYRIWHILQTLTLSDSSWETERASCNFTQAQMSDDRDLLSAALARLWISRPACIQQPETMTDRVWERRSLNIWSTVHCSVWYEMISHSYATERALRNAEDRSVKSLSCFVCRWTTK